MATTYELIVKVADQGTGPLSKIQRGLNAVENQTKRTGAALRTAAGAVAAFASGAVVKNIINQYRSFERYRTVLATYMGTQEKANKALGALQKLANDLPQDLDDITRSFVLFKSRGIETTAESLTAFSNIATANGKSLTQLGEAVADALTGEFERMKEFGIKVSKENDKFVADIGNGQKIIGSSTTELVSKLRQLGEEGGKFGSAASQNATTLDQSFSNLNGSIFSTSVAIGEGLRPALKGVVDDMSAVINKNQELAKEFGVNLGQAVKGVAQGIKFLSENIDLMRNALLSIVAIRFAQSMTTIVGTIARFTSSAKSATGFVGGLGKAMRGLLSGVPIFGRLAAALGPIGLAITGLVTAFTFFQDTMVNVGGTAASMGEVATAVFQSLGDVARQIFNYLATQSQVTFDYIKHQFGRLVEFYKPAFEGLARAAKTVFNNVVNTVISAISLAGDAIMNLPRFFAQAFGAVMTMLNDFGNMVGQKFTNLGEALKLAFSGDLAGAMAKAGEDVGYSFANSFNEAVANVEPVFTTDVGKIFEVDRFNQAKDMVVAGLEQISETGGKFVSEALAPVIEKINAHIEANRAQKQAIDLTTESVENINDALGGNTEVVESNTTAIAAQTKELTEYQKYLKNIEDRARRSANEVGYKAQAIEDLNKKLRDGKISVDVYAEAMEMLKPTVNETKEEVKTLADTITEKMKQAGESLSQSLATSVVKGKSIMSSFKNFFDQILIDILQSVLNSGIQKALGGMLGGGMGGGGGGFGSLFSMGMSLFGGGGGLGSLFSGFFANGGIAAGGKAAVVGEQGPELFLPGTTGRVVPNDELGGGGSNVVFQINAIDTQSGTQFLLDNKGKIVNMINQAQRQRGKRGIID